MLLNDDTLEVLRVKYANGLITYPSLCMNCISSERDWGKDLVMLTGYCLAECRCDRCKSVTDLAMCKVETAEPQTMYRTNGGKK